MTDKIVVNVPPYEGEYEFDLEAQPFSTVEWRWVKQISGYLPLTISTGWEGADPDLFLAFAVIAMRRAGKIAKADVLGVAEEIEEAAVDGVAITVRGGSEEAEVDPQNGSAPSDSKLASGESLSASTEPSQESEIQEDSGTPDSATGLDSPRLTSVT